MSLSNVKVTFVRREYTYSDTTAPVVGSKVYMISGGREILCIFNLTTEGAQKWSPVANPLDSYYNTRQWRPYAEEGSKWMDSLEHRPDLKQPVWICNGDGGVVASATYMGTSSGYCHGLQLHGTLPGLRDDHYFWQPRQPVTPPATRVFVKPERIVGGWISVEEQSPTNGQRVWAAEENGTVFLSIYYDACKKGTHGFYTYEDNGTHDRTVYWMPLESHKPTLPLV